MPRNSRRIRMRLPTWMSIGLGMPVPRPYLGTTRTEMDFADVFNIVPRADNFVHIALVRDFAQARLVTAAMTAKQAVLYQVMKIGRRGAEFWTVRGGEWVTDFGRMGFGN